MTGGGDHAILVNSFCVSGFPLQHCVLDAGSSHCVTWLEDYRRFIVVSFRSHPSDGRERVRQMRALKDGLNRLCGGNCTAAKIALGGDGNFVTSADEQDSSVTSSWLPGREVLDTWNVPFTQQ